MISKTVDSTTFNFGRSFGLCMRNKKTGRVDDLSLVGFPWQLIYVSQILLKKTENDQKF